MGDLPLRTPIHRGLGRPLPCQLSNGEHAHPIASHLINSPCGDSILWSVRPSFNGLSSAIGQVAYLLLTRAPVATMYCYIMMPLDLHVLGLSLAFILSQDQTLRCMFCFLSLAQDTFVLEILLALKNLKNLKRLRRLRILKN